MNEKLLQIINYYGVDNQLKHFIGEVYELIEAIHFDEYFTLNEEDKEDALEHIKEEIGDLQTMLDQFKLLYNATEEEIESVKAFKIDRQIRRIEESK